MSSSDFGDDDPVPPGIVLALDEVFRVLEALEDARLALREAGTALGLQDELATVIRMLHVPSASTKEECRERAGGASAR